MSNLESRGTRSARNELKAKVELSDGEQLAAVALHYGLVDFLSSPKEKVVCPLHDDLNPSMMLDFNSGMWYCFGCGESGKAQKLVKQIERKYHGLNEIQAMVKFSKIMRGVGIDELPKFRTAARSRAEDRELYAQAYDFYHGLASINWYDPQFIEAEEVLDYMESRGFTSDTLQKAKAKVTFEDAYSMVFPMMDNGKFRGWVSRTMDPEIAKYRKYLYNKGFSRSNTVVGDYKGCKYVVIVEGYMDRLKLVQLGVSNAVAILGWKLSPRQIEKLKSEGVQYAVAATDNDEAGRKGAAWIAKNFQSVRWPYLKGLKDPGDFDERSFSRMWKKLQERMEKAQWVL